MATRTSSGPTQRRPRPINERQLDALRHLAAISLNFPGMVVPTRKCEVRMDLVRALARRGLIGWQLTDGGQSQGIVVTSAGLRVIESRSETPGRKS